MAANIRSLAGTRNPRFGRRTSFTLQALAAASAVLILGGCLTMSSVTEKTSGAPENSWTPPAKAQKPPSGLPEAQIRPEILEKRMRLSLADLVDVGLSNNPQTRAAWDNARMAAATVGAAKGAYLPLIDVSVAADKTKAAFAGGRFIIDQTTLNPEAMLSLLIFDFGGREFAIQAAQRALEAANWAQNSVIQNVILQVESSYYQYLAAKALLKAQEANLKSAEANHEAARERHEAGVATIADVLQAKTAVSSVELDIVTTQGLIQVLHGRLADAMGLPASVQFEVADELPAEIQYDCVSQQVDQCIRDAEARRPDLASARSLVLAAQADIRRARSAFFPTISADANYGRIYYQNQPVSNTTYSLGLTLDLPIFTGMLREYQYVQAKLAAESAKDQMIQVERRVDLDVWTSYYGVKTAEQRLKTANDLLESASASYDVALGRYREGVGSILDLLAAQTQLEDARVQIVRSKAEWFLALVQFMHDTGALGRPATDEKPGPAQPTQKGDHRP